MEIDTAPWRELVDGIIVEDTGGAEPDGAGRMLRGRAAGYHEID